MAGKDKKAEAGAMPSTPPAPDAEEATVDPVAYQAELDSALSDGAVTIEPGGFEASTEEEQRRGVARTIAKYLKNTRVLDAAIAEHEAKKGGDDSPSR